MKSKNYRSVSGYVELEFTESVSSFWGMRFPDERIVAPKPPSPAVGGSVKSSDLPRIAPAAPPAPKPVIASVPPPQKLAAPPAVAAKPQHPSLAPVPPHVSDTQTLTGLPKSSPSADTLGVGVNRIPIKPEVTPALTNAAPVKPPSPAPVNVDSLKLESTKLQEQLSSLSFESLTAPSRPTVAEPVPPAPNKVIDIARKDSPRAAVVPPKTTPARIEPVLDEEVKIPSWLEPLARNAAAASHEAAAKEAAPRPAASEFEVQDLATAPVSQESQHVADPIADTFAGLPVESVPASRSNKGVWIAAIAATILVAAAVGTWYFRQNSSQQTQAASAALAKPLASAPVQPPATPESHVPANSTSAPLATSAKESGAGVAQIQANTVEKIPSTSNSSSNSNISYAARELANYKKLAEPEPKKPILGEVHLATPNAASHTNSSAPDNTEAPALEAQNAAAGAPLDGGGFSLNAKQPAAPPAPLPVGGDVKAAHLLSSVPPAYPALARTQHISGDVRIDALVGIDGRVTSMKVISGPTLLHQAAMDALHQWKYSPAILDGNPVPMHLTVTVQFRLQ